MARARTSPSGTLKSSCRLVPAGGGCCVQINRPPSPKFSRLETYFSFPFFQTTRVVLCALRLGYRRISRSTVICQLLLLLIFLESSLDCTEPKPSVHVSLMSKVCGYPNRALVGILFSISTVFFWTFRLVLVMGTHSLNRRNRPGVLVQKAPEASELAVRRLHPTGTSAKHSSNSLWQGWWFGRPVITILGPQLLQLRVFALDSAI
jgi:hypothetical protein